jgi:hypothetical protein
MDEKITHKQLKNKKINSTMTIIIKITIKNINFLTVFLS